MAVFTLTLETARRSCPKGRQQDIAERAAIQQALLTVLSAVSNRGEYSGVIDHKGARGQFSYEAS
jgi:hypothetical protein